MFDAKSKITKMQGKDYLEVKWRIAWFRDEHPKGSIITDVVTNSDPILVKATIIDGDNHILATGYGTPKMQGIAKSRPFEGAETAAVGRALAHAGYGTQFTDEFDEGDHLADAPVEKKPESKRTAYIEHYTKLLAEAAAAGIETSAWELPEKVTDDEIIKLGKSLRAEVDAKEKK